MEPTIELNTSSGRHEASVRALHLSKRRIFITGVIDSKLANDVIMELLWLQTDGTGKPIDIYINSPGGEVGSGLAIYDVIQSVSVPINMYCVGLAASMSSLILAGGQKGRRYILPHSRVMIHEPYLAGGVSGSVGNIQNTAVEMLRTQQSFNGLLAKHTGKNLTEIEKAADHDNFMNAEESVSFGICDSVVSELFKI